MRSEVLAPGKWVAEDGFAPEMPCAGRLRRAHDVEGRADAEELGLQTAPGHIGHRAAGNS